MDRSKHPETDPFELRPWAINAINAIAVTFTAGLAFIAFYALSKWVGLLP